MTPQVYLTEIKVKLVASPGVVSITIIEERTLPDRGYFRGRLILSNNDFLEVAEQGRAQSAKGKEENVKAAALAI